MKTKTAPVTPVTNTAPKGQKLREPWVDRLVDLLAGWLLTASMCMVVDAQFPTQAGVGTVLWHTAAAMAAMTLLTLRWWVLPSALGVGLLTAFFILLPMEQLTASLHSVKEFFLWWFANLPLDSPWYTPQTMYILHSLIHIGLSVLVFTMLRLFRRCWPLVTLGGALQVFILLVASKDNSALSLGLYLSGVFPLLARDRYSGRRMFSRRQRYAASTPRWKASLACGLLCVAMTAAMMVALPADTSEIRLRAAANGVADLQTVTDWYLQDQKANTELTLHGMGLQPSKFRLGGDLVKPEPVLLATTDLKKETLVKVGSFDTFTGKKWTNAFTTGYRVNGFWDKKQAEYLASPLLVQEEWQQKLSALGVTKDITVTLTEPAFLLPTVGQTLALKENTYEKSAISFNERGELLTYTYPVKAGFSYTLTTMDIPLDNSLPEPAYLAAALAGIAQDDPILASDEFFFHYVAVPDNISEDVKQITRDLTDGVEYQLEQVLMLSRYFSLEAGYVYDETPGKTAYNDNVVDQVFRTKRGYCVHYATAMAMMTRILGVPTRLAAGYRTVEVEGTQAIVSSEPYVWVECYFKNLGWLSFDPTPGKGFNKPVQDKPLEEAPPPSAPQPPDKPEGRPNVHDLARTLNKWVPLVIGLLLAVLVAVHCVLAPRHYRLAVVRGRYPHTRQQAIHYYRDILRQLRLLGYPLRRGDTLYELLTRFDGEQQTRPAGAREQMDAYRAVWRELRDEPADHRAADTLEQRLTERQLSPGVRQTVEEAPRRLQAVVELLYAHREPTDEQVEELCRLREDLEVALQARLDPLTYVLRRRLLLPPVSRTAKRYK